LTAYWFQKRNLLLELKTTIQDHPLVPDLFPFTYFHICDDFFSEESFQTRCAFLSGHMILHHLVMKELSSLQHPLLRFLLKPSIHDPYLLLLRPFLQDIYTLNHPLYWLLPYPDTLKQVVHPNHQLLLQEIKQKHFSKIQSSTSPTSTAIHFAFMAKVFPSKDPPEIQKVEAKRPIVKTKVDLELMHYRLGHQSFQSLLAASHENLWEDISLRFAPETFCIGCKVATSRSKNRGHSIVSEQTRPGQVLFMDLQPNPSHQSIIKSHWNPYYLNVVCAFSRYGVLLPVYGSST
jgi:hypothetical protein